MATLKEIRIRVSATKNMQKITKAMKMVAAAKLRRAQDRILSARPYASKLNELFTHIISVADKSGEPLMEEREIKTTLVVVITSDRGLCGAFNTNILKYATNYIAELNGDVKMLTIGKKCSDYFIKKKYNVVKHFNGFFNDLSIDSSRNIVKYLLTGYLECEFDKVVLIYNEFKSVVKQNLICQNFLPLISSEEIEESKNRTEYIYEPSSKGILGVLIPKQLNVQFWKALLESNAAEQGARMTAMETATNNAEEMLKTLGLVYNRARQDSITKELLEIVSGAEALKASS